MVRAGVLRRLTFLTTLILAACGDLPTGVSPGREPAVAGPVPSGECRLQGADDCITSTGGGGTEGSTVAGCTGGGGAPGGSVGDGDDDDGGPGGDSGDGPGGGGGGSAPRCPDFDPECGTGTEPEPDTCNTGEQIVDAPGVSGMLQELWLQSRLKGVEKGGWIVADGNTFRLVPFQHAEFTACGIDLYESPPPGTVSMVHTHPRPLWSMTPCGYVNTGTPSQEDVRALQLTGLATGYFLDENAIGKFSASGGELAQRIARCGY